MISREKKSLTMAQVRVGMSIGHHPNQSQYTPDMPKYEENVTAEDRQEAKRRIEGSLAPNVSDIASPATLS